MGSRFRSSPHSCHARLICLICLVGPISAIACGDNPPAPTDDPPAAPPGAPTETDAPAAKAAAPAAQDDTPPATPDVGFMGKPEADRREYMRNAAVVAVKKGKGGRSLAFKFTFEDGSRAYFKPEQSFSGAHWYAEVAAYHIDRALGLGRVPPVVARSFSWSRLKAAARTDKRTGEVTVDKYDTVRGALVHWIDDKLSRAKTPPGWEGWVRVTSYPPFSVTPCQRPALYTAGLVRSRARRASGRPQERYYKHAPSPRYNALPAELADMLVLDYLTHNIDRWGGENTNLLTFADTGALIYLDNGAGFFRGPHRQGLMEDRLKAQQCFRRSTIDALEKLDVAALGKTMAADPLGPFLDAKLLAGLEIRRTALLARVQMLMRIHGENAVLKW